MTKYNAKKIEYMGIKFDSQMEANYYLFLLTCFNADEIELQPRFDLQPAFINKHGEYRRKIEYIADFMIDNVVIDCKGFTTESFKIKKKLFEFKYPDIRLMLVTRSPKWTGKQWIELDELTKLRKQRKRENHEYTT